MNASSHSFTPATQDETDQRRSEQHLMATTLYRVRQNKVAPFPLASFAVFFSNRLEFQRKILHTYLVIIVHLTVISAYN